MAFDPISLALAGGGIVSQILGGNAAKEQAQQALAQQLSMFNDQMRFAKSARTDAYGNRISYDDALREWITQLSPTQNRIVKAGEHEQLLGLTEDAARNRSARRRQEEIGKQSLEDYNTQATRFRYGGSPSEGAIFDDIASLLAYSRGRGSPSASRQSIRTKRRNTAGGVPASGPEPDMGRDLLQARAAALDEFTKRTGAHNQQYLPAMEFFRGGAGGGGGAPINYSSTPERLAGREDAMAQLIAQVGQAGAANIGKAQGALTEATAKSFPTISDSARLIAALRGAPVKSSTGLPRVTQMPTGASSTSYTKTPKGTIYGDPYGEYIDTLNDPSDAYLLESYWP